MGSCVAPSLLLLLPFSLSKPERKRLVVVIFVTTPMEVLWLHRWRWATPYAILPLWLLGKWNLVEEWPEVLPVTLHVPQRISCLHRDSQIQKVVAYSAASLTHFLKYLPRGFIPWCSSSPDNPARCPRGNFQAVRFSGWQCPASEIFP